MIDYIVEVWDNLYPNTAPLCAKPVAFKILTTVEL